MICKVARLLLDQYVVRPLEPAGHIGDVRQRLPHGHTGQQWQPAHVGGSVERSGDQA